MKTKAKFILLGLLAFLVGSAFATPLLISELEIVPFWTIPQGPKADFTASIIYANFSIQNDLPRNDVNLGDYYESNLDYFFVLNITNLSNIEAKLSGLYFAGVKNTTIAPCAIGGFHSTHQSGWKYSGRYGPLEGYLGHIGGGRVEELWLDGKLYNKTWVPEGGLEEIWRSQNIFPTKELETVWETNWYPSDAISHYRRLASEIDGFEVPPVVTGGGSRTDDFKNYYTHSIAVSTYEEGNFWIEGIPLIEHVADNDVKTTAVYINDSWIDATGRIDVEEKSFVFASDLLLQLQTGFYGINNENTSIPTGTTIVSSPADHMNAKQFYDFDNVWEPFQSKLVMFKGSLDIGNLWRPDGLLNDSKVDFYLELHSFVADNIVNGVRVYTGSMSSELVSIELQRLDDSYQFSSSIDFDEEFVFDLSGSKILTGQEAET